MTAVPMTRIHGMVPVKKKSKTLPSTPTGAECAFVAREGDPVEEAEDQEAERSTDFQPVAGLELAEIHVVPPEMLVAERNQTTANRTPCQRDSDAIPVLTYPAGHAHRPALRLRQDRHRRARRWSAPGRMAHRQQWWHGTNRHRRRCAGHRPRRPDRCSGDPRPPGGHAAPQGARRPAGRPHRSGTSGRHGRVRHRADRSGRGQPVPVRQRPQHRADRHRRPGDGPRRGEEPRARRAWSSTRPTTPPCSTRCRRRARCRPATRRRLARDAFAAIAAYDAEIATWFDEQPAGDATMRRPSRCRRDCTSRWPSSSRCATARTRISTVRGT